MMRGWMLAAGAAMVALAQPASAVTTTLDFDAAEACTGPCINGSALRQAYGDSADVDMSYRFRQGFAESIISGNSMFWWNTGFGDLQGIAFVSGVAEVAMMLQTSGKTITLDSFDMARFTGTARTELRVYDANWTLLWSVDDQFAPNGTSLSYAPGVSSTLGLFLQHGPNAANRGFDNIRFTVSDTPAGGPAVPEPASWAMLLAGFGVVGSLSRRRRSILRVGA